MTNSDAMQRARLGQPRKLYSAKGTLLGIVHYPPDWDEVIQGRGGIRVALPTKLSALAATTNDDFYYSPKIMEITRSCRNPGAVHIYGVTLEEFEVMDGCAFTPSAGYLRSLLADE